MSRNTMEGAATARRALRVLEAVATAPDSSLTDIMARLDLNKGTAYRLVRVLEEESYVERTKTGGFVLGPRMVGLAAAALPQLDLYAGARPILRALVRASGETVTLHRRSGSATILVLSAENEENAMRLVATVGEARPVTRGSAGLSQLAFASADDVDAVLESVPAGDRSALRERLAGIRETGYAISLGENHPGVHGLAVPVATGGTAPTLSLAVSGPALRWTRERMIAFVPELRATKSDLERLLALETSLAITHRSEAR